MDSKKKFISNLFLGFVIFSIGFAIGKEVGLRRKGAEATPAATLAAATKKDGANRVVVYYFHGTFRCATCNRIEALAKSVVDRDFAAALADGSLEWRVANFQETPELSQRYGVAGSVLVVVRIKDGKEVEFKRLDEVWIKIKDDAAFTEYVEGVIRTYLAGGDA